MVFDTLSSLFGSVPADVVVDSIASGLPSKLLGAPPSQSRLVVPLAGPSVTLVLFFTIPTHRHFLTLC